MNTLAYGTVTLVTLAFTMLLTALLAIWSQVQAIKAHRRMRRKYVEHMLEAAYWNQRPLIEGTAHEVNDNAPVHPENRFPEVKPAPFGEAGPERCRADGPQDPRL